MERISIRSAQHFIGFNPVLERFLSLTLALENSRRVNIYNLKYGKIYSTSNNKDIMLQKAIQNVNCWAKDCWTIKRKAVNKISPLRVGFIRYRKIY
jgi:hypothetical protein